MEQDKQKSFLANLDEEVDRSRLSVQEVVKRLSGEKFSLEESLDILNSLGFAAYRGQGERTISVSTERADASSYPSTPAHGTTVEITYQVEKFRNPLTAVE